MSRLSNTIEPPKKKQGRLGQDLGADPDDIQAPFQDRTGYLYFLGIALAILILGINLGISLFIHNEQLRTNLTDFIPPIVDLLACLAVLSAVKISYTRMKRLGIGWGLIGVSMLVYALGDITWLIFEVFLDINPFPSIADGFYLAYYPIFLAGVFLLVERQATRTEMVNRSLDMAVVIGAAILGFWNFLIGPIVASNSSLSILDQIIALAYPVGDLVIFGALILLLFNRSSTQAKAPLYWLGASVLIMIVSDSIFSYQSLLDTYVSGSFLDLGWIAGILFVGLAGITQRQALRSVDHQPQISPHWKYLKKLEATGPYLPYFWLVFIVVLISLPWLEGLTPQIGRVPLTIGVAGIVGLVLIRQILALSENRKLNVQLEESMRKINIQATELMQANLKLKADVAERKKTGEAILASEIKLSEALRIANMAHWEYDVLQDSFTFNDQFYTLFHTTAELEGGYSMSSRAYAERFVHPEDAEQVRVEVQHAIETSDPNYHSEVEHRIIRRDGELGTINVHIRVEKDEQGRTVRTHGVNQDISQRKNAEAGRQQSQALFQALFELSPDAIILIDPYDPSDSWPIVDCNLAACQMNGFARNELVGHSIDIINSDPFSLNEKNAYLNRAKQEGILRFETQHRRKDGSVIFTEVATTFIEVDGRKLLVGIDHDITNRKRSEEEIKQRLFELEAINKVSSSLRVAQTLEQMLPLLLDKTLEVLGTSDGAIWLLDDVRNEARIMVSRGWQKQADDPKLNPGRPGEGINKYVLATGQELVAREYRSDSHLSEIVRQWLPAGVGGAAIPIRLGENVAGSFIVNVSLPRELEPAEVRLLSILAEVAGNAIQRTILHQQTERRLQQLSALRKIEQAISSTFDMQLSLGILLENVAEQLGVDAADVLMLKPDSFSLTYAAGRGFRTKAFSQARLRLGEGYAGRAALTRSIVHISDLADELDKPNPERFFSDEKFVSYYGVPLITKGRVKGVLEIFHRSVLEANNDWLEFLNLLAGQTAIALDNGMQFEDLQASNMELVQAYDETIEGWSRALDLRDEETEGHTWRVTEMAVTLARKFNFEDTELVHIRWGALLHDIGKMGVPDGILLKPGPLTDEEWVIMKKHPQFAQDMLSPIHYLGSSLDIPYHHHEKWDGTGYPLGLKGEAIPLAVRIFSLVDVWDALTSDRPYRKAWSEDKALAYIQEQAGKHFDPAVVHEFIPAIQNKAR